MPTRPGLYAPGLTVMTGGIADAVKAIDADLVTVFNAAIQRFEVYDRAAPGGPKWQIVLRVQEPDGSFRQLDSRVLPPLRQAKGRDAMELIDHLEAQEDAVERNTEKRTRALGEDLYEIAWAMGKRVVPPVAWRDRTDPDARARIRAEAGLA